MTGFADWLSRERGLRFDGYDELWNWSVTDLEGFRGALADGRTGRSHRHPHILFPRPARGSGLGAARGVVRGVDRTPVT